VRELAEPEEEELGAEVTAPLPSGGVSWHHPLGRGARLLQRLSPPDVQLLLNLSSHLLKTGVGFKRKNPPPLK
jgi:hypothetical protein